MSELSTCVRTLVLSSRRVPADLRTFTRGARAVLISNAADVYGPVGRDHKVEKDTAALRACGFAVTELDLREHSDAVSTRAALAGADLVWAGGGNTFTLVHLAHRSGLYGLLPGLLDSGVVWGGESAGAVACAPSMAGVDLEDDPRYSPDPSQPGLGLVPFLPWAHWTPTRALHANRHDPLPGVSTPMYRIKDGEYLLVQGRDVELRRTRPERVAQPVDASQLSLF